MNLTSQKIVLHNKIINKTWTTKNKKDSDQCFGENYIANHFATFLQGLIKLWRVGALTGSTGYFFIKN